MRQSELLLSAPEKRKLVSPGRPAILWMLSSVSTNREMILYNQIPVSLDAVQIYYSDRQIHLAEKMRRILQLDNIEFCILYHTEATAGRRQQ
jgi:hypothetical protein